MRSTHRCGEQRTKGICSHHNPIFEFDRKDRRASDNGLPARGLRAGDTEIAQRGHTVCVAWRQEMSSTGSDRDYGEDRLRLYRNCHISAKNNQFGA